jgi:hypothetical protein
MGARSRGLANTVGMQPSRKCEGKAVGEGAAGREECFRADSRICGKRAGGEDGLWDHRRSGWESGGQCEGGDKCAEQVLPGMTDVCDTGQLLGLANGNGCQTYCADGVMRQAEPPVVVREAVQVFLVDWLTAVELTGNFRGYLRDAEGGSQRRAWGVPGFARATLARRNEA